MSHRPRHDACPACRLKGRDKAGNNLYHYEDGHEYCFSCGYRKDASVKEILIPIRTPPSKVPFLPVDAKNVLPAIALEWLAKYEIIQQEVMSFNFLWSERLNWLIFPLYNDAYNESLLGYQARNFSGVGPKYRSEGNLKDVITYYNQLDTKEPKRGIILVEDMVSAIKVSRSYTTMPLFGSFLSFEQGRRLRNFFDHLYFWLDYDKTISSMTQAVHLRQHGFQTHFICSEKDPKEYTDEEIISIVDSDRPLTK
ncbi:MAG: hypothetical protein NUV80_06605 [Candidatus Berkelbacteria bacterium]|nr:hypothetical protein [Candidatus Berkelbacteria bacterium]